MLREVTRLIAEQDDGTLDGQLRSRLCAAIFLIGRLPATSIATIGLRATSPVLADLLMAELPAESTSLRQRIPQLLAELVETGTLRRVDDEYRLQTREDAQWETGDPANKAGIDGVAAKIAEQRTSDLRKAVAAKVNGVRLVQDGGTTTRDSPSFPDVTPQPARRPEMDSDAIEAEGEPHSPQDRTRVGRTIRTDLKRTVIGLAIVAVAALTVTIVVGVLEFPGRAHAHVAAPLEVMRAATPAPGQPTPTPASPTSTPVAAPTPAIRVVAANGDGLYLRPSPDSRVILTVIPDRTMVIVLGPTEEDAGKQWTYIRLPSGKQGWVASAYLAPIPAATATP